MPVLLHSTSSYFKGINPEDPSTLLADVKRRPGQTTGPNDISPVTKQYVAGMDEFTFQIMNLKPIYGYGFHALQVNGTTRNLRSGQNVKIGFVDSHGKEIQWTATPTRYGFDVEFFISENNNPGPAIFEIAGEKRDGTILSLIERFVIDTNPPPKPYGIGVKKRGFHTVDIGWFYATGYGESNKKPTHDHDLSGFHIWASTASLANTTHVTSSAPIKTIPASDAQLPPLTTRSFATSIDGIDQDLIVKDKTLYFYVSSFDDVGNENLKDLQSSNLVFGPPGIPTGSNPNVWITIPERNVGQLDWSSYSEISATQSALITSSKYVNAPVYTTGTFGGDNSGPLSTKTSLYWHNVLHTSSGELTNYTMFITSSVGVTGSKNFAQYVGDNKPFTSKGSGALFLVVNTRSAADLKAISQDKGAKFSNKARLFFVASGSQSFTAGPTASSGGIGNGLSYPFPMLPMKPDTDYIISFRIKATSSLTMSGQADETMMLPPLKMAFTASTLTTRFSMARDDDTGGFAVAPLTFSVPSAGPGVDSLLDLTTTPDPSSQPSTAFDPRLRFTVDHHGSDPVRVQVKFNTNMLETQSNVYAIEDEANIKKIGVTSKAPNFDMTLPYFFTETPSPKSTGSILGPIPPSSGWFLDGLNENSIAERRANVFAGGGGGLVLANAQNLSNTVSPGFKVFQYQDGSDPKYASGGGNSGSRFSGTWLGERDIYIHNKGGTPPASEDVPGGVGWFGKGHMLTGSNFYGVTSSVTEPSGAPMILGIGLTGSRIWAGPLSGIASLSISQEHKNKQYPFLEDRGVNTSLFIQNKFPPGTNEKIYGWPYLTTAGAPDNSATSGSLRISGSTLPSYTQLGIRPDRELNVNRDGHHHVLTFTSLLGTLSKAARPGVLRAMEDGTGENAIADGSGLTGITSPGAYPFGGGWNEVADSGSLFYYSPPSASIAGQTLVSPIYNEPNYIQLNKIFGQNTDDTYFNKRDYGSVTAPSVPILTDNDREFYVTGSGFLSENGSSNVVAVYAHSDNPSGDVRFFLNRTIDVKLIKLTEFTEGGETDGSGFGVLGQNLGGQVQSSDGYGSLAKDIGNSGSAVLKIKIPTSRIESDDNTQTRTATVRFKIVNKGGFTGSIYNGSTYNLDPAPLDFRNDPRCGEYLQDEINKSEQDLVDYRNNSIGVTTPLIMAFSYRRASGGGT